MDRNQVFARAVLAWVCFGHVLTGVVALISGPAGLSFGAGLYGAEFQPSPQFEYAVRPLGAFMLGLAYLQLLAFREPCRFRHVVDATLLVMGLRLAQRCFFAGDIFSAFGIPPGRHWTTTAVFAVTAALLLAARLGLRDESPSGEPVASRGAA